MFPLGRSHVGKLSRPDSRWPKSLLSTLGSRAARGTIAMRVINCVEDLRLLARRRVPRMFYDYADSGSWTESTYRANEADLAAICFRQRVAVNIENRSVRSTMIGEHVAMPVALAPTGLCGMQHADGEILATRAAEAFCSIEDVEANATKPFWFQLYVMRNRGFVERPAAGRS